jgi:hypothetical protein
MEKPQEKQAGQRMHSFEGTETITKPENTADRASTGEQEVAATRQFPPDIGWLALAAYWIREMLWRRKFWLGVRNDQERSRE